jgi:hypothetical protein
MPIMIFVKCPNCISGKLNNNRDCYPCNATGKIDLPKAYYQIEYYETKGNSLRNNAEKDKWLRIAKYLQMQPTEFEDLEAAIKFLDSSYEWTEFDNELTIGELSELCVKCNAEFAITAERKFIVAVIEEV